MGFNRLRGVFLIEEIFNREMEDEADDDTLQEGSNAMNKTFNSAADGS